MIERFQDREMTPDEKDVVEKVEKFGWMVMNIKDDPGKPGWSYTVGLFGSYKHPEIVMFGLKDKSRHDESTQQSAGPNSKQTRQWRVSTLESSFLDAISSLSERSGGDPWC